MSQYETLLFLEQTGAATLEIIETATTIPGVANSTEDGTVCCFLGADDDSEISPEDFNERFQITDAIYE